MEKQNKYNKGTLIIWASLYVLILSALIYLIYYIFDLTQRSKIILNLIGTLSMLLWVVLLVGFTKFDGTNNTRWSKLLYDMYPYPSRKKEGNSFREVVFPAFIWSFCFFVSSAPLFIVCIGISFAIGLFFYNPIGFLINNYQLGFHVFVSLVIFAVILAILHNYELRNSDIHYNRLAILRTLFGINVYFIGYGLLLAGIAEGCNDVLAAIHEYYLDDLSLITLGKIIVKPFFNLSPGALLLFYCRRNLNILLYAEDQYYLYLRSFQNDGKDDFLMSLLPAGEKQIMKIGNPCNSLLRNFLSCRTMQHDVLFLPSANWEKHLEYYVHKAYSVIIVVDDTQGVIWEMFHHSEYYHKIVFWVESREKINKLKIMAEGSTESNFSPILHYCIQVLNDQDLSFPFVFWIKDKRCYYETDIRIVSSLLSSKLNKTSISFFDISPQKKRYSPEKGVKGIAYFEDWNIYTRVLLIISKTLNIINTKLPWTMFAFMILCSYLVCLMLVALIIIIAVKFIIEGDAIPGIIFLITGACGIALLLASIKELTK